MLNTQHKCSQCEKPATITINVKPYCSEHAWRAIGCKPVRLVAQATR